MDCEQARELLLGRETVGRSDLAAHLSACAACSAQAERAARLEDLIRPALLTAPPTAVADAALRAALAAAPILTPARHSVPAPPADQSRLGPPRSAAAPSPAAYPLAGAVFVLLVGWLGVGPIGTAAAMSGSVVQALGLVLASPALWLLPSPAAFATGWPTWVAVIALAWGLRTALATSGGPAPRPVIRSGSGPSR